MYEKYLKRILDFVLSLCALILLSPVILFLAIIGIIVMRGNPFFTQKRPGKNERIFVLYKFRTMTSEKDNEGNLLPDSQRLTRYGKFLRNTSLDELPELINIIKGDMSIVGPRPLLIRDMVFMTKTQRMRHSVRQGLTGLAQVNGRNNILWEEKLELDLRYIENISFMGDLKIILKTIKQVIKKTDVVRQGTASDIDYGDYLLESGKINKTQYDLIQIDAKKILLKR